MLKAGADAGGDTQTMKQSVVSHVLTNAGLMANLSIDGTKLSPAAMECNAAPTGPLTGWSTDLEHLRRRVVHRSDATDAARVLQNFIL